MSDEPSLPRLPPAPWDAQPKSFLNGSRKRIRAPRFQDDNSQNFNSSDPAIFSSDDDPGLDNYVEGRRKKRYIGSWFQQHPASSDSTFGDCVSRPLPKPSATRKLARKVDSGVYLASDGAESEDMMDHLDTPVRSKLPQLERPPLPRTSSTELELQKKIAQCLEDGNETLDFWSMGLKSLSNETVAPLAQFSCIPQVTKDVAFEQKEPNMKIFLAQNLLTRLPGALFDLENLTTLSLRGNRLTELPPAVAKLRNLKELNVSLNQLRYLPIELLDLTENFNNLQTLVTHPNPFLQPGLPPHQTATHPFLSVTVNIKPKEGATGPRPYFASMHKWRSPLQISSSSGRVLSDFKLPPAEDTSALVPVEEQPNLDSEREASSTQVVDNRASEPVSVPSLLEIALRSCSKSVELPDLPHYIPDGLPHLRQLLNRAVEQKESGGLSCSQCRKPMVMPVVEFIEWRVLYSSSPDEKHPSPDRAVFWEQHPLRFEHAVPFLHRGCSERCGPRRRYSLRHRQWDITLATDTPSDSAQEGRD